MTTYYARVDYSYSGDSKFTIPFSYIKKEHIVVFVNKTEITNYTYITSSQIEVKDELLQGDIVSIRRTTPINNKIVNFNNLNVLNGETQNLAQEQVLNAVQEMYDKNQQQTQDIEDKINDYTSDIEDKINEVKQATDIINTFQESVETCVNKAEIATEAATTATEKAEVIRDSIETINKIGDLNTLITTDKTNIVNAINEAYNNIPEIPPATTITTYYNVVSSNNKTVVFGGDYSSISAIDISAYADNVYRVFVKNQNIGIIPKTYTEGATAPTLPVEGDVWHYIPTEGEGECYKQYLTVTTPATEEGGEATTTTEWQVIDAVEVAKIKIAGGRLAEILSSLQYMTNTPLTEVKEHTSISADSLTEDEEGKINFIPFTFTPVNYTDYDVISANTNYTMTRDGVFYATAIASVTYTDGDIPSTITTNIVMVKAGDTFKSSVAGKFYYYY